MQSLNMLSHKLSSCSTALHKTYRYYSETFSKNNTNEHDNLCIGAKKSERKERERGVCNKQRKGKSLNTGGAELSGYSTGRSAL